MDSLLQLADVGEGASPDPSPGDLGKEAFHLVQPTGAGGGEVQVIAWVPGKPALHLGGFVRPLVIHHQVNFRLRGQLSIHLFQKFEKLLRAMPALAVADHFAGGDFQAANREVVPCRM